jgi:hypothetical protein
MKLFKEKGPYAKDFLSKHIGDEKKKKQMWKVGDYKCKK